MFEKVETEIRKLMDSEGNSSEALLQLKELVSRLEGTPNQPVSRVVWVDLDQVQCNTYNPNSVAQVELRLLQLSILSDGYTQPIVTFWDAELGKYVIVDGFHRYFCCKSNKSIASMTGGKVPIVCIKTDLNGRMAATVRHNRARGAHSVEGMSDLVFKMLEGGMSDAEVCNELGMEPEEILKLKHLTGFSKLFEDCTYKKAWESTRQIKIRQAYLKGGGEDGLQQ